MNALPFQTLVSVNMKVYEINFPYLKTSRKYVTGIKCFKNKTALTFLTICLNAKKKRNNILIFIKKLFCLLI